MSERSFCVSDQRRGSEGASVDLDNVHVTFRITKYGPISLRDWLCRKLAPRLGDSIKEVRALANLGLKEAKDLVESVPCEVLKDVPKEEANAAKEKLEAVSGKIEIK